MVPRFPVRSRAAFVDHQAHAGGACFQDLRRRRVGRGIELEIAVPRHREAVPVFFRDGAGKGDGCLGCLHPALLPCGCLCPVPAAAYIRSVKPGVRGYGRHGSGGCIGFLPEGGRFGRYKPPVTRFCDLRAGCHELVRCRAGLCEAAQVPLLETAVVHKVHAAAGISSLQLRHVAPHGPLCMVQVQPAGDAVRCGTGRQGKGDRKALKAGGGGLHLAG